MGCSDGIVCPDRLDRHVNVLNNTRMSRVQLTVPVMMSACENMWASAASSSAHGGCILGQGLAACRATRAGVTNNAEKRMGTMEAMTSKVSWAALSRFSWQQCKPHLICNVYTIPHTAMFSENNKNADQRVLVGCLSRQKMPDDGAPYGRASHGYHAALQRSVPPQGLHR
jgi:hypothetical protein